MTKPKTDNIDDYALYRDEHGNIKYNSRCMTCTNDCRQSHRVEIVLCPNYSDHRKNCGFRPPKIDETENPLKNGYNPHKP